jgi:hypothetical protein
MVAAPRLVSLAVIAGLVLAAASAGAEATAPAGSSPTASGVEPLAPPRPAPADLPPALAFQAEQKSPLAALAIELFPGAGSLYADDAAGALLTWGLMIGGAAAALWGVSMMGGEGANGYQPDGPAAMPLVVGGIAVTAIGRGYGFVNAFRAAGRHNDGLRARLGMPPEPASPAWSR